MSQFGQRLGVEQGKGGKGKGLKKSGPRQAEGHVQRPWVQQPLWLQQRKAGGARQAGGLLGFREGGAGGLIDSDAAECLE